MKCKLVYAHEVRIMCKYIQIMKHIELMLEGGRVNSSSRADLGASKQDQRAKADIGVYR